MAKHLLKLLLQASFACCLAVGFANSSTSNNGFEAIEHNKFTFATYNANDVDSPDTWLQFSPLLNLLTLCLFACFSVSPRRPDLGQYALQLIRAPPVQS